mmetsp:Transcript_3569/g.8387  ORF Transcript_3569/g.8387 Transcript_3569/m.8387 type:complete len:249 (-) Transcript_3569:1179-1925(-)
MDAGSPQGPAEIVTNVGLNGLVEGRPVGQVQAPCLLRRDQRLFQVELDLQLTVAAGWELLEQPRAGGFVGNLAKDEVGQAAGLRDRAVAAHVLHRVPIRRRLPVPLAPCVGRADSEAVLAGRRARNSALPLLVPGVARRRHHQKVLLLMHELVDLHRVRRVLVAVRRPVPLVDLAAPRVKVDARAGVIWTREEILGEVVGHADFVDAITHCPRNVTVRVCVLHDVCEVDLRSRRHPVILGCHLLFLRL